MDIKLGQYNPFPLWTIEQSFNYIDTCFIGKVLLYSATFVAHETSMSESYRNDLLTSHEFILN